MCILCCVHMGASCFVLCFISIVLFLSFFYDLLFSRSLPTRTMASPAAPVQTLFGSTGGVSTSGRPASKTSGEGKEGDDGAAAVR